MINIGSYTHLFHVLEFQYFCFVLKSKKKKRKVRKEPVYLSSLISSLRSLFTVYSLLLFLSFSIRYYSGLFHNWFISFFLGSPASRFIYLLTSLTLFSFTLFLLLTLFLCLLFCSIIRQTLVKNQHLSNTVLWERISSGLYFSVALDLMEETCKEIIIYLGKIYKREKPGGMRWASWMVDS